MESKHTKLPWSFRDLEIVGPYLSNKSICEMTGNYMDEDEAKANVKFIVKACNAHDELVKGYKNLIYEYECALKLIAESIGMVYSENDFVITNKQLLKKVTPINEKQKD